MESGCLLKLSQEPATRHSAEPDQPSLYFPSHFLLVPFNIILSSKPTSSKWFLSLKYHHQHPDTTFIKIHSQLPVSATLNHPQAV
jgi:hypothetical protein